MRNALAGIALVLAMAVSVAPGFATPDSSVTPTSKRKKVRTAIAWKVTPGNVVIYLDGKKLGTAAKLGETRTRPGRHTVRLVKGEDETEMDVKVNKGHVLTFAFEFSE